MSSVQLKLCIMGHVLWMPTAILQDFFIVTHFCNFVDVIHRCFGMATSTRAHANTNVQWVNTVIRTTTVGVIMLARRDNNSSVQSIRIHMAMNSVSSMNDNEYTR
jgi:hypothetical protein